MDFTNFTIIFFFFFSLQIFPSLTEDQLLYFSINPEKDIWFSENWFMETDSTAADMSTSIKVDRVLYRSRSKYQDILIFYNSQLGNVLALNGSLQLTEWDEFVYHEMAVHIPLFAHPNPKNVLIIGGGDGGCVREVLKHSTVEKIVLVEVDEELLNASKKYFPLIASSLDDPKVRVRIGDGFEFIRKCAQRAIALETGKGKEDWWDSDIPQDGKFDVIITDNSQMDESGQTNNELYKLDYFENIQQALREPDGIMSSLAGSYWLYVDLQRKMQSICHQVFPTCHFVTFSMPSWESGREGLLVASLNHAADLKNPSHKRMKELKKMKLQFYNREVHRAAFAIPQFIRDALKSKYQLKLEL